MTQSQPQSQPHTQSRFEELLTLYIDEYTQEVKHRFKWPLIINHDLISEKLNALTEYEFNIMSRYHDSSFNEARRILILTYDLYDIEVLIKIICENIDAHPFYFEST